MVETAPKLLTADEAAEVLRITPRHVRKLVNSGELPGRKMGGRIRIHAGALDRMVEQLAERGSY